MMFSPLPLVLALVAFLPSTALAAQSSQMQDRDVLDDSMQVDEDSPLAPCPEEPCPEEPAEAAGELRDLVLPEESVEAVGERAPEPAEVLLSSTPCQPSSSTSKPAEEAAAEREDRRGGFLAGQRVQLRNLQNDVRLNGAEGVIKDWDSEKGRWAVCLDASGETRSLLSKNLAESAPVNPAARPTPAGPPFGKVTFHCGQLTAESVRDLLASGSVEEAPISAASPLRLLFSNADKPRTYRVKFQESLVLGAHALEAGHEYLISEKRREGMWAVNVSSPDGTHLELEMETCSDQEPIRATTGIPCFYDNHLEWTELVMGRYKLSSTDRIFFSAPKFNQWAYFQRDVESRPLLDVEDARHKAQFFNGAVFGIPVFSELFKVFGLDGSGSAEQTWLGWVREQANARTGGTEWTLARAWLGWDRVDARTSALLRSLLPLLPKSQFVIEPIKEEKLKGTVKAFVVRLREVAEWKKGGFPPISADGDGLRRWAPTLEKKVWKEAIQLKGVGVRGVMDHRKKMVEKLKPKPEILAALKTALTEDDDFEEGVAMLEKFQQACEDKFPDFEQHFPDWPSWISFVQAHVRPEAPWNKIGGLNYNDGSLLKNFGGKSLGRVFDVLQGEAIDVKVSDDGTKLEVDNAMKGAIWLSKTMTALSFTGCMTDVVNFFALFVHHAYNSLWTQTNNETVFFGGAAGSEQLTLEVIENYGNHLFRLGKILIQLQDYPVNNGPSLGAEEELRLLNELHNLHYFFGAANIQRFVGDMEADDAIVMALLMIVPVMFNEAVALAKTKLLDAVSIQGTENFPAPLPLLESITLQLAKHNLETAMKQKITRFVLEASKNHAMLEASPSIEHGVHVLIDAQSSNGGKVAEFWRNLVLPEDPAEEAVAPRPAPPAPCPEPVEEAAAAAERERRQGGFFADEPPEKVRRQA